MARRNAGGETASTIANSCVTGLSAEGPLQLVQSRRGWDGRFAASLAPSALPESNRVRKPIPCSAPYFHSRGSVDPIEFPVFGRTTRLPGNYQDSGTKSGSRALYLRAFRNHMAEEASDSHPLHTNFKGSSRVTDKIWQPRARRHGIWLFSLLAGFAAARSGRRGTRCR
jgi:hypothetical protein